MTDAPYPIGTPGRPWGTEEVAAWRSRQTVQRSYRTDVLSVIDTLRSRFDRIDLQRPPCGLSAPRIQAREPLSQELQDFATAIRTGSTPVSNSRLGLEIVLGLEALEQSLANRGEPVAVRPVDEVLAAGRRTLVAEPSDA